MAANKIDALDEPDRLARLQARAAALGLPCLAISAAAGTGVDRLLEAAWPHVAVAAGGGAAPGVGRRRHLGRECRSLMPARLGLLGGTFDPVHEGHMAAGRAARAALALDHVQLVPARTPPHRAVGPGASTAHRFAMAAIAALEEPGWTVSDAELERAGPSFTYDTLQAAHDRGLSASQIFFITGADAFAEIATWSRYPEVLDLAHFVVVTRPGSSLAGLAERLPGLAARMRRAPELGRRPGGATDIVLVDAATPDVSSTVIRARAARGYSLAGLVPPRIEQYIRRHGLYVDRVSGRCLAWRRRVVDGARSGRGCPRPSWPRSTPCARRRATTCWRSTCARPTPSPTGSSCAPGQNRRQVQAIADAVEAALKARKLRPSHVEGYERGEWVLLDYFDFVVHVFAPNARMFYGLERLWGNARAATAARTGTRRDLTRRRAAPRRR